MEGIAVPIPVDLVDDPWVRLLSGKQLRAALRDGGLAEGFRVAGAPALGDDRPPGPHVALAASVSPQQLRLSPDGSRVELDVAVMDGDYAFPGEDDTPGFGGPLPPAQARRRLASLLRWPAGDKQVTPAGSSHVPGLYTLAVHVGLPRPVRKRPAGKRPRAGKWQEVAPIRLPFAVVRPEATGQARRWAAVLADSEASLDPVAGALGLAPGRWEAGCPPDVARLPWLAVSVRLAYRADSHVAVQISVTPTSEARLAAAVEGVLGDDGMTGAALSGARAWPGRVLLYAVGRSGGPLLLLALEVPGPRSGARVLARTALRAALRGMPEDALSARLRALWQDPRRLAALRVLYSL